eukprot:TRINITY_DN2748_c0_g1_i1.p1 TRINITY_DN2748_c0_g1~~TRINITY_DN2748_c0_g1_i1.p1  ORF type:complete len:173 (-),score=50.74 TRINITY_DN2748_c0_g1_i1:151-669(-)
MFPAFRRITLSSNQCRRNIAKGEKRENENKKFSLDNHHFGNHQNSLNSTLKLGNYQKDQLYLQTKSGTWKKNEQNSDFFGVSFEGKRSPSNSDLKKIQRVFVSSLFEPFKVIHLFSKRAYQNVATNFRQIITTALTLSSWLLLAKAASFSVEKVVGLLNFTPDKPKVSPLSL